MERRLFLVQLYFKYMSLLEKVAEYFGASFQDDHFQVNKLGHWTENNRIAVIQKARQGMKHAERSEIGRYYF
jgi:hypothetical protein